MGCGHNEPSIGDLHRLRDVVERTSGSGSAVRLGVGAAVDGGTMLVVQSELSGVEQSLASVRSASLDADVVARQWIPFGPALSARTQWLERTGQLRRGCR